MGTKNVGTYRVYRTITNTQARSCFSCSTTEDDSCVHPDSSFSCSYETHEQCLDMVTFKCKGLEYEVGSPLTPSELPENAGESVV